MIEGLYDRTNYLLAQARLDMVQARHKALASNLANIETPGYKRVDVSPAFESQLASAVASGDPARLRQVAPIMAEDQTAAAVRGDGNNVAMDRELLEINRNSLEHQFLTQYAGSNLNRLKTAITGRSG